jgi:dephospho-CoA kinase
MARLIVGLTGGIGSGKTAVSDRLATQGVAVVDADVVAREVVAPGEPALQAIAEYFGAEALLPDGALNRPWLRERVFADPQRRRWLEALTHPLIGARLRAQLDAADTLYVVLVSPLLLEGEQRLLCDWVVVVDIPEALQLERALQRDGSSEATVRAIMNAQLSREQRLAHADQVLDNSGSLQDLQAATDALHMQLLDRAAQRSHGVLV